MKQYQSVIINGYTTEKALNEHLNRLAREGYSICFTVRGNIILLEKELENHDKDAE